MKVLVGTASWSDKSLIASKKFYPKGVSDPESRLRFYATQFPLVEVDTSYYAIPLAQTAQNWADRTPAHFTMNMRSVLSSLLRSKFWTVRRIETGAWPVEGASRVRSYALEGVRRPARGCRPPLRRDHHRASSTRGRRCPFVGGKGVVDRDAGAVKLLVISGNRAARPA